MRAKYDSIDGLRGVAAAVVAFIFHWQNFGGGAPPAGGVWFLSGSILEWLQRYGWLGVDLFFLLSGFIFEWKYGDLLTKQKMQWRDFFILRFSRLYPLHLLTTLLAGVIAWAGYIHYASFPIYGWNDVYHLALNLVFLQHSGLQSGFSFNGPAWSLTLEGMCYILFFLICRNFGASRLVYFSALAFLGACIIKVNPPEFPLFNHPQGRAFTGFFIGCLLAAALRAGALPWLRWVAAALLCIVVFTAYVTGSLWGAVGATFYLSFNGVVLPCILVCALGFKGFNFILSIAPLRFLGAISYSVYMIHAVVQMTFIQVFRSIGIAVPAASVGFFAVYVTVVIFLATISHYLFEKPVQAGIRMRYASAANNSYLP